MKLDFLFRGPAFNDQYNIFPDDASNSSVPTDHIKYTRCTTEFDMEIDGAQGSGGPDGSFNSSTDIEACRSLCASKGAVGFRFGTNVFNCHCTDYYATVPYNGAIAGTTSCVGRRQAA